MVSVWNNALKMKDVEVEGQKPILELFQYVEQNNMREKFLMMTARQNQNHDYDFDIKIVLRCWIWLISWTIVYVGIAVILLEGIDRDKR